MLAIWYGGTFDPVHNGHLAIARAAADTFGVPVTLVPAADPPHRTAPGADAAQRAHMLDLAVAGDRRLRVDRRELQRAGPSWTVDTLRELRAERGAAAPLALLVGADSFRSLPTWKHWRQLPELAHFIVAGRDSDGDAPLSSDLAGELRCSSRRTCATCRNPTAWPRWKRSRKSLPPPRVTILTMPPVARPNSAEKLSETT